MEKLLLVGVGGFLGSCLRYGLGGWILRIKGAATIEIVDAREKIEAFLPVIDGAIAEGLVTVEPVHVRFYRSGAAPKPGA